METGTQVQALPADEKESATSNHVDHLEHHDDFDTSSHDPPNFHWNYDVITNLAALYASFFAAAWGMGVGGSIAFVQLEYPTASPATTTWIAAAPSLCLAVGSIFLGDLSDILGRRWFLIVGNAVGTGSMIMGGRCTSVEMLIAGQVFNGIAVCLGFLALPMLAEMVPKRWRGPIIGGGTFLTGLVGIGGSISQGAFMKYSVGGINKGWRIGFYMGAGFFCIAFLAIVFLYHPGARPNPEGRSTLKLVLALDWIGIFVGTAGLVLFLVGLQYGGNPYPWGSAQVLALVIIGAIVMAVFVIWEWKGVKEGLFPNSLFEHRNFALGLVLNFIEGLVVFSAQAFTPQILVSFVTTDLVLAGVYNAPSGIVTGIGAAIAGYVAAKTKEVKWVVSFGVICFALGPGLLCLMRPDINLAAWIIPSCIMGTGIGVVGSMIPVITSLCTPNRYIATSISVGNSLRGVGGAIGLVIFSQIFQSKLKTILPAELAAAALGAGLPPSSLPALLTAFTANDVQALQAIPGISAEILLALDGGSKQGFAKSFRFIWYSLIPFAGVTLIMCFFLKSTKEQMTLQVASAVQSRKPEKPETSKLDEDA